MSSNRRKVPVLEMFIVGAEVRRDMSVHSPLLSWEERQDLMYHPVTLIMTFPPGELAEMRRRLGPEPDLRAVPMRSAPTKRTRRSKSSHDPERREREMGSE